MFVAVGGLWIAAFEASFVGFPCPNTSAAGSESIDLLNRKTKNHRCYPLAQGLDAACEDDIEWSKSDETKATLLATGAAGVAAFLIASRAARPRLRRSLFVVSLLINSAARRVVVFATRFHLRWSELILSLSKCGDALMANTHATRRIAKLGHACRYGSTGTQRRIAVL